MAGLSCTCQAYAKHTSGVSSSATAADTSVDNYGITHQTGKNRHFKQWSGTIGYIYIWETIKVNIPHILHKVYQLREDYRPKCEKQN